MPEEQQNQQQTADQQADQQAGGQEQQQQQTSDQEGANTFTQDQVNNFVAKESKKAQEKLLKQLGIEDVKSAKDGLAKFKEWQESQKTEQEKLADSLKEYEEKTNTLNDENSNLKAQISAFKIGVHPDYTDDVVTLAKSKVSDDVTIDDAMKEIVEKYPHFKGSSEQENQGKPNFSTGKHQSTGGGDAFAKTLLGG